MPYVALDPDNAEAAPSTTIGQPVPNNGMTLEDLDNELEARLLGRTDMGSLRRRTHINLAYTDLTTGLDVAEAKASLALDLVADQFLYRLPPCVHWISNAALIDDNEDQSWGGHPLDQMDLGVFRGYPQLSDRPTQFFKYGSDLLVLWPTPDVAGTIVIDFQIRPIWLTADGQCPILSIEWHEAILLTAQMKCHQALMENTLAATAENNAVKYIRKREDLTKVMQSQAIVRSSVPRVAQQLRQTRVRFMPPTPFWRRG